MANSRSARARVGRRVAEPDGEPEPVEKIRDGREPSAELLDASHRAFGEFDEIRFVAVDRRAERARDREIALRMFVRRRFVRRSVEIGVSEVGRRRRRTAEELRELTERGERLPCLIVPRPDAERNRRIDFERELVDRTRVRDEQSDRSEERRRRRLEIAAAEQAFVRQAKLRHACFERFVVLLDGVTEEKARVRGLRAVSARFASGEDPHGRAIRGKVSAVFDEGDVRDRAGQRALRSVFRPEIETRDLDPGERVVIAQERGGRDVGE